MKSILNIALLLLILALPSVAGEVKTLNPYAAGTQAQPKTVIESVNIPDGSVAEIITAYGSSPVGSTSVIVTIAGKVTPFVLSNGGNSYAQDFSKSLFNTIRGPATISAESKASANPAICLVTVKILTEAEYLNGAVSNGQPSLHIPSNSVVIPEDATGPVNIILESSTDLITWTAALPGTYGKSTTKRFFRVRGVANP